MHLSLPHGEASQVSGVASATPATHLAPTWHQPCWETLSLGPFRTNCVFFIVIGKLEHFLCLICVSSFFCHFLQNLTGSQSSRHAVCTLRSHKQRDVYPQTNHTCNFYLYVCGVYHLLPGYFSQLLVVLDNSPKKKVSGCIPPSFRFVLLEWSLRSCLVLTLLQVQGRNTKCIFLYTK